MRCGICLLSPSLEKGVPHVVPRYPRLGATVPLHGADAAVIIPWVVYQTYGDTRILKKTGNVCTSGWITLRTTAMENGLWMTGFQYGDWLALDKEESADRTGATDKYMIANAY